jgi:hypothetical protein
MKPKEAINLALNNNIFPRVKIKDIKWSPLKNLWKVRIESSEEGIGNKYRYTIYFDASFIQSCEDAIKNKIRVWK